MTIATCSHCGVECDSRLVKPVEPPDFPDGGVACYGCRDQWGEIDDLHEQDRIDAARWRALRPLLREACIESMRRRKGDVLSLAVDDVIDALVQIAQEQKP